MSQDMAMTGNIKQGQTGPRKKTPKKITQKYLYNSGLAYLQRFPATTAHFKKIMLRKIDRSCRHHAAQDKEQCALLLQDILESFERMGLLNDGLYLQGSVNSYRKRGMSEQMIIFKLQQKGLNAAQIRDTLAKQDNDDGDGDAEVLAALVFMRKKRFGPYRTRIKDNQDSKEIAAFARNGFSINTAQKVLTLSFDEAEEQIRG